MRPILIGRSTFSLLFWCLFLCGASAVHGQSPDSSPKYLASLLTRMQSAMSANGKLTQQYTSDELVHTMNFDKNGKTTVDRTEKYENVFVEGLPYRRKVEENGKPLSGKEAEAETKRYEEAVTQRKGMSLGDKRRLLQFTSHFQLPLCCLATLFDNRVVKHETIRGRDTIMVESVPKQDARPDNKDEKTSLSWKETTWIDSQETMPVRFIAESVADQGHIAKGTMIQMDFDRMVEFPASEGHPEQAVWQERRCNGRFRIKIMWMGASGTSEQTWSNYKRFHVDMRLLADSIEAVPDKQGNLQR